MITIQIIAGSLLLIFGLLVTKFSKPIAKYVIMETMAINLKNPKKITSFATTNDIFGESIGYKLIFWTFGILPTVLGLIILITGIIELSIFID